MKKAKLVLVGVSFLAIIGATFAFKVNRQANAFYSMGFSTIEGMAVGGCVIRRTVQLTPVPAGGFITTLYSSGINTATTTCTARVMNSL